ncbi:unnamed protein product, partial [Ectocarpus fasciculatus]
PDGGAGAAAAGNAGAAGGAGAAASGGGGGGGADMMVQTPYGMAAAYPPYAMSFQGVPYAPAQQGYPMGYQQIYQGYTYPNAPILPGHSSSSRREVVTLAGLSLRLVAPHSSSSSS